MGKVHRTRAALRDVMSEGRVVGTFIKLASLDTLDLVQQTKGLDFVLVDLEHSSLHEADAIALVRHADALQLPALVRLPEIDSGLVVRLLENGAAGIQLSTLKSSSQSQALIETTRFPPEGQRSLSLANRASAFGRYTLEEVLSEEEAQPPIVVGQVESRVAEPLTHVAAGLDVLFVGTTDLRINMQLFEDPAILRSSVEEMAHAAEAAGVAFGGWTPSSEGQHTLGLAHTRYLVVGSDQQLLATGLRDLGEAQLTTDPSPDREPPREA